MRRVLRRFKPDVLHCHSSKAGGVGRLASLRFFGRRPGIVYSPHSIAANINRKYLWLEHSLARLTDVFVAVSAAERDELAAYGLAPANRIEVARQAIDTEYFSPRSQQEARRELGLAAERHVVLGIGRLVPQKDPLLFVDIAARVVKQRPEVRIVWVGDGELRPDVEAQMEKHGLTAQMSIAGWKQDVRPYVAAADVVVMTSRYEGISTTAAEALAMDRPVAGTDIAGVAEVVHPDRSGFLFAASDPQAGADHVLRLLDDVGLRMRLAATGRAWVSEHCSLSQLGAALERAYRHAHERATGVA